MTKLTTSADEQTQTMRRYYRMQSKIYDLTRWSFLFGRRRILRLLPLERSATIRILEVGCGTGVNLKQMALRFPHAAITGYDVSPDMIRLSRRHTARFGDRVQLHEGPYLPGETALNGQIDLVLFSYSLTMINPQWPDLILQAKADLREGGLIAVTDFHDSRFSWFKSHMGANHVRMDGHLKPFLEQHFQPITNEVRPAYGSVWDYLIFIGKNTLEVRR